MICLQKFNTKPFGLQFIKLYTAATTADNNEEDETKEEQTKIGSYFAKIKATKDTKPVETESNDKSSNVATELLKRKSMNDSISSPPAKKLAPTSTDNEKSTIMKKVVFVLSGFQNPLRSELRTKATTMGATYSDDWDGKCTHLMWVFLRAMINDVICCFSCAFPNTPKFAQVQQSGKGVIVNQKWILDCYTQKRFLPDKSYRLKGADGESSSETESEPELKPSPKRKTPVKKKPLSSKMKQGDLPNFFHGIRFYVSYGDFTEYTLVDIIRVIFAYDGTIERQIDGNVDYVITKRLWNSDFEKVKIARNNPLIKSFQSIV